MNTGLMKRINSLWSLILIVFLQFIFTGCKNVPKVTTDPVTEIEALQAKGGGNVLNDRFSEVTERGVCWSVLRGPDIFDSICSAGPGTGWFFAYITQLKPGTTYFVRAYATNNEGTGYGHEVSFTTSPMEIGPVNFNPSVTYGSMTDQDGNVYKTVTIGTQVWMAENLKTTKYRNGDPIPDIPSTYEWNGLETGAYCDYDNYADFSTVYGHLYNWYAVKDSRNLAPAGWHIPTLDEWILLRAYYGETACDKLKEKGYSHWMTDANQLTEATNESGFTAVPGGYREWRGFLGIGTGYCFDGLGMGGWYWTSSEGYGTNDFQFIAFFTWDFSDIGGGGNYPNTGYAVRCIKD